MEQNKINDDSDVRYIMYRASIYGLTVEVESSAQQYISQGYNEVQSYSYAAEDWDIL
jgi:hypothetical protein